MTADQKEEIILIPPTHEQSVYTFHVEETLAKNFLAFLKERGLTPWRPPENQEKTGPDGHHVVQIEVDETAGPSAVELEGLINTFLNRR